MSLIRFDTEDDRGPSGALLQGLVDWVKGSLQAGLGNTDFDDHAPLNTGNYLLDGTTGFALTLQSVREGVKGVARLGATAGSNACAVAIRNTVTELDQVSVAVLEARYKETTGDDAVQLFLGLTDQVTDGGVFASSALKVGANEDHFGFLRNIDGTVDVVSVVDGAAAVVLIADVIGAGLTPAWTKLGLRIERMTTTVYRLTPYVDGVAQRSKAVNVASTAIPLVAMRPVVAVNHTDNAATPALDIDFTLFIDK